MKKYHYLAALALAMMAAPTLTADETGDLKITFKIKGDVPAAQDVKVTQDVAFCGKFGLKDESLVINPKNKGIANVFVFVYTGRGGTKLDKFEPQGKVHELANKDCRFEPHALVLQTGDTLKVTNPDDVGHNANLQFFNNKAQNFVIPAKQEKQVTLTEAEPAVTEVACNIHPWMKAQVLVLDHPFAAVSDADGVVTIKGLPVGKKIVFRASHESGTFKNEIYIDGKKEKWKSNKFEMKIKAGMNDMGVVEVPLKEFD